MRLIDVEDGSYNALIGRILYLLQAAEDGRYRRPEERPAELASLEGLAGSPDTSAIQISGPDHAALARSYQDNLGIDARFSITLFELWIDLFLYDYFRDATSQFNLIHLASGILERLRPDIHADLLSWAQRFRQEFVFPYTREKGNDEVYWQVKRVCFEGALEDNPLLNCVLYTNLMSSHTGVKLRQFSTGRPAEVNRGKMCAYAVRKLRTLIPRQSNVSINKLTASLPLSPFVKASIPLDTKYSVYAFCAPLLAALFKTSVTPDQVKASARRYDSALMKDHHLRKYTAEFE